MDPCLMTVVAKRLGVPPSNRCGAALFRGSESSSTAAATASGTGGRQNVISKRRGPFALALSTPLRTTRGLAHETARSLEGGRSVAAGSHLSFGPTAGHPREGRPSPAGAQRSDRPTFHVPRPCVGRGAPGTLLCVGPRGSPLPPGGDLIRPSAFAPLHRRPPSRTPPPSKTEAEAPRLPGHRFGGDRRIAASPLLLRRTGDRAFLSSPPSHAAVGAPLSTLPAPAPTGVPATIALCLDF